MEQKIKIIKLIEESKKPSKKQLYNDILSSSKKVKDIIKKTKVNKNRYNNYKNHPEIEFNELNSPKITLDDTKKPKVKFIDPEISSTKTKSPQIFKPKKTKCNKQNFIKFDNLIKKTLKNIPNSKYKSKKMDNNCNASLKYVNNHKKKNIRLFTLKEINKFINVLTYYGEYEQFQNIHKYIKKLNKYQTNQILQNLGIINGKSNAPIKMLKNILYNYFCCNLIISK